jgi:hypothetical protein
LVELKPWFSGKRLRAWQTGETWDRAPGLDRRWKLGAGNCKFLRTYSALGARSQGPPQLEALGCEASKAAYSLSICAQHIEFERALLAPQRQSGEATFGHPGGERGDPALARLPMLVLGGRSSPARFALVQIVNAARRIRG